MEWASLPVAVCKANEYACMSYGLIRLILQSVFVDSTFLLARPHLPAGRQVTTMMPGCARQPLAGHTLQRFDHCWAHCSQHQPAQLPFDGLPHGGLINRSII